MRHVATLIGGIALLACQGAIAAAAPDTVNDGREAASEMEGEKVMAEFAKCVIRTQGRENKALAYLQIPESDPALLNTGYQIARSDCAPRGGLMRFKETLFSRSLYTALYQKHYRAASPGADLSFEPVDHQSEFKVRNFAVGEAQLALRTFGDCATQQNPKAAHDFVLSEMRSDNEKNAVSAIVGSMQQCLTDGVTLKFSRTYLKGIVAESLYKARNRKGQTFAEVTK